MKILSSTVNYIPDENCHHMRIVSTIFSKRWVFEQKIHAGDLARAGYTQKEWFDRAVNKNFDRIKDYLLSFDFIK